VGLPVALFLGRFERLAVRGVVLVALGIVVWLAIREASTEQRSGLARMQPRLRASLALVVDATLVGSIVLGVFAIGRRIVEISANGWVELCVAGAVLVIVLLVGRGGQTPGETLFSTQYWQPRLATTR
jgi:uncharacterized membrane protein